MIYIRIIYEKILEDKNNYLLFIDLKCDISTAKDFPNTFNNINKKFLSFFKKYNVIRIDKSTFKINIWFFNFLLFIFSKYNNINIDTNNHKIMIQTEQEDFTILDDISNIIDNNKNIYNWIDNEIENNPSIIKNIYLQNILSDKLKTKYNHILAAKYFDLI